MRLGISVWKVPMAASTWAPGRTRGTVAQHPPAWGRTPRTLLATAPRPGVRPPPTPTGLPAVTFEAWRHRRAFASCLPWGQCPDSVQNHESASGRHRRDRAVGRPPGGTGGEGHGPVGAERSSGGLSGGGGGRGHAAPPGPPRPGTVTSGPAAFSPRMRRNPALSEPSAAARVYKEFWKKGEND